MLLLITGCQSGDRSSAKNRKHPETSVPQPVTTIFRRSTADRIGFHPLQSAGTNYSILLNRVAAVRHSLDYDRDGNIDIYVCNGTWLEGFTKSGKPDELPENHLYRNVVTAHLKCHQKGQTWVVRCYTHGRIALVMINNDGYPDLYISNYGTMYC